MFQHLRKYLTLCCVGFATLAASAGEAQATLVGYPHLEPNNQNQSVLLSDLLNGEIPGIVVGDKIFEDFFYSTLPNDDMPEPNSISVFGFQDLDGNLGISFHGVFWDLPGGGPSDALIRFTVGVSPDGLAEGYRISDAHLFLEGVSVGPDSYLAVDESFQGINQTLNTFATTLGGPLVQDLADEVIFGELYTKLRVTKDILAFSGDLRTPCGDERDRPIVLANNYSGAGYPGFLHHVRPRTGFRPTTSTQPRLRFITTWFLDLDAYRAACAFRAESLVSRDTY